MEQQFLLMNTFSFPILSTAIFLPLVGAVLLFFIRNETAIKATAFITGLINLVISFILFSGFNPETHNYQFGEFIPWIPSYNIHYVLGIDGITIFLILLTTLLTPICVLCSWTAIKERVKEFMFCLLIMECAMIGVFCALDFILFYIFWEAMLIPMYLLIAIWGGPQRDYASIKFFIYTLFGSVFLLVAIIAVYLVTGSFSIPNAMFRDYSMNFQIWVFLAFAIAFAIKVPMFPFHTWLPAAHTEAPTAGSVFLASVLLKMGTYGFLRFCLPITPKASEFFAPLIIVLSLIGIIYGGYVCLSQTDMKKLIAYSSVAHMGFVTLGIFSLTLFGFQGALLQMLNHGVTTGALFLCVGIIYERTHSRQIYDNAGLGKIMPIYVGFFGLFSISSFAFPGTNNFIGELYVLLGIFKNHKIAGLFAIPGAVLAAAYMLRLLKQIVWGREDKREIADMNIREVIYLIPLCILVFWMGLFPRPFVFTIEKTLSYLHSQLNFILR
ncbi:MAG TPA: NADH-quinone oxidoreductase subunit M [Syntrophorhabdaceae bacterium]|nr:NADH-quinone oxidoreductase subunit M [Syntrophorhabdaceae bacterium]HOT42082.1 NADH-quinone oxidoreductase subunit M [Syntrophorhabdaceae bacterium]HPC66047.1 NADH-quinone oxidoreductase subunit M [Syntrophorhabdaceae bacterium]HQE79986.1 NADH-quinone oxidoreductase subunit M [Syntrophorhabdaceae bacterium]HQH43568.1 NADH-quinone oxidoreductase subunit M [Syntrophorhabdaceae bacterium]